ILTKNFQVYNLFHAVFQINFDLVLPTITDLQMSQQYRPIGLVKVNPIFIQLSFGEGFHLAEGKSPFIICHDDSSWTAIETVCEAKSCGAPPDLENGYYKTTSVVFGGIVTYYCNEGYSLVGEDTQTCVAGGWDGRTPVCDPATCDDLSPIENGQTPPPPQANWEYENAATFTCNPTYTLIGEKTIYCRANGTWSDIPPKCKVVQCVRPDPPIKNGRIIAGFGPTYEYRQTIIYKCDEGFEMVGKDTIECRENSTFPPAPLCIPEARSTPPVTVPGGSTRFASERPEFNSRQRAKPRASFLTPHRA
uniref:Sushi domain-containing protein n=1 Tax=Callorhinchus milii TaxID=7868 RepID=A0A4W3IRS5_CALMI